MNPRGPPRPQVVASFTGSVWEVKAAEGALVQVGEELLVLEAMKMEHPVEAPVAGRLHRLLVGSGQLAPKGTTLVLIEPVVA